MTRCFTRWSLLVSACLLSTRGYSVTDLARNYHVKAFTLEDGLPNNTIHCLLQAHDGYLWIGTRNGLARFDGLKFTIYDQSATPAFVSNDCLSLAEDSAGTLWIGTA